MTHICAFEQMLDDEGTLILKFFLHITKDEQRARLQARIEDPEQALEVPIRRSRGAEAVEGLPASL